jgi:hypothetical protein
LVENDRSQVVAAEHLAKLRIVDIVKVAQCANERLAAADEIHDRGLLHVRERQVAVRHQHQPVELIQYFGRQHLQIDGIRFLLEALVASSRQIRPSCPLGHGLFGELEDSCACRARVREEEQLFPPRLRLAAPATERWRGRDHDGGGNEACDEKGGLSGYYTNQIAPRTRFSPAFVDRLHEVHVESARRLLPAARFSAARVRLGADPVSRE